MEQVDQRIRNPFLQWSRPIAGTRAPVFSFMEGIAAIGYSVCIHELRLDLYILISESMMADIFPFCREWPEICNIENSPVASQYM